MKDELSRCPVCKRVLVGQELVHAIDGQLFCSKTCAVQHLTDDYILNAKEMALEAYASNAELVATEDVLGEDLQEVRVTLTCTKVIKLPADLTEAEAVCEASSLWTKGLLCMDPEDCDESSITYELVKEDNSSETV